MSVPTLLTTGTVFAGDYKIASELNQGGMGAVYVAEQISTGKARALKLMHPQLVSDPELRKRFEQEARIGSRIASEHVVEVNAAGVDAATGLPYLIMELLSGEDLMSRVKRAGPMPMGEVLAVFEQLSHAMAAAHAAGIIHRDLKPENVFLSQSLRAGGPTFTVKVLDFGIAKLVAEAGTHGSTGAMGSPLWMAPEQTDRGTVTPAADVWAMGLIAYFLLVGKVFWRAANLPNGTVAQILREIVLEPIPPSSARAGEQGASSLPIGFDVWFAKCLDREPEQRFANAADAWAALSAIGADPLGATAIGISSAPMTPPVATPIRVSSPASSIAPNSPAVIAATSLAPSGMTPPPSTIPSATPPAFAHTQPPAQTGRWMLATSILAGLLVTAIGLGVGLFFLRNKEPTPAAAIATAVAPTACASVILSATPPDPTASVIASAAPSASQAPKSTAGGALAQVQTPPKAQGGSAPAPTQDDQAPTMMNPHNWKLKNGHFVRMLGSIVKNDSNVDNAIVTKAVEWSAWQYNTCYDRSFGQLPGLGPQGTVVIGFDILDQLPRFGRVERSEFTEDAFNKCVMGTLIGQTINAAGPNGKGHVSYAFKFVPN